MAPSPITQPDCRFQPTAQPGRNTVYHSAAQQSVIDIPVMPGARPEGPAPACGSLDHQPCRAATSIDQLMRLVSPKIVP
jgi:hypothetical protein